LDNLSFNATTHIILVHGFFITIPPGGIATTLTGMTITVVRDITVMTHHVAVAAIMMVFNIAVMVTTKATITIITTIREVPHNQVVLAHMEAAVVKNRHLPAPRSPDHLQGLPLRRHLRHQFNNNHQEVEVCKNLMNHHHHSHNQRPHHHQQIVIRVLQNREISDPQGADKP
jgi:hypothetical protein